MTNARITANATPSTPNTAAAGTESWKSPRGLSRRAASISRTAAIAEPANSARAKNGIIFPPSMAPRAVTRRPPVPHHRDVTAALSDYASRSWAALREAGSNPSIRLVVLASIVFTVSKWALRIAKYVYLYEVAGPFGIATLGLIQIIPSILGVPFASELGDRFARERVLAVTYSLCAVVSAALAYVLSAGSDIIFFYLLAAAVEVLGQIVRPMQAALLPGLARTPSELVAGNVALSTSEAFGALAGPALGAAILVSGGPALVVLVAAGVCAISVLAVTRVHVRSAAAPMALRVSSGVSGFL